MSARIIDDSMIRIKVHIAPPILGILRDCTVVGHVMMGTNLVVITTAGTYSWDVRRPKQGWFFRPLRTWGEFTPKALYATDNLNLDGMYVEIEEFKDETASEH